MTTAKDIVNRAATRCYKKCGRVLLECVEIALIWVFNRFPEDYAAWQKGFDAQTLEELAVCLKKQITGEK